MVWKAFSRPSAALRAAAALFAVALAASACDPCTGTSACVDGNWLAYQGEVVTRDGRAAPGVEVRLYREGGVAVPDTLRSTTNAQGIFEFFAPADSAGEVRGRLQIVPAPPNGSYTILRARFVTSPRREFRSLGRFVITKPLLNARLRFLYRGNRDRIARARVQLHRTGGVTVKLPVDTTLVADTLGEYVLRADAPETGELEWTGTLFLPGASGGTGFPVRLTTPVIAQVAMETLVEVGIGPSLAYAGTLRYADGRPAADVPVVFRRTSGLAVRTDSVVARTDTAGVFWPDLQLVNPFSEGEIVGVVRVPLTAPRTPVEFRDVRLQTFVADGRRVLGTFTLPFP